MKQKPKIPLGLTAKEPSKLGAAFARFIDTSPDRLVVLVVYVASLLTPAIKPTVFNVLDQEWQYGYSLFMWGWLGVFAGQFAWLANPAIIISQFKIRSMTLMLLIIFILFISIAEALTIREIPDVPADRILAFGIGYHLWITASIITLVSDLIKLGRITYRVSKHQRHDGRKQW